MGKNLCTCAEAEGIATHHPGLMTPDVALSDSSNAETKRQDHCRTYQKPNGVKDRAIKIYARIELGHPQAGKRGNKPARDQYPPVRAMPVRFVAANTGDELESTENAKDSGAENVQHNG